MWSLFLAPYIDSAGLSGASNSRELATFVHDEDNLSTETPYIDSAGLSCASDTSALKFSLQCSSTVLSDRISLVLWVLADFTGCN